MLGTRVFREEKFAGPAFAAALRGGESHSRGGMQRRFLRFLPPRRATIEGLFQSVERHSRNGRHSAF